MTLENQIITLESAQTQRLAVDALAAGVGAQKSINQQMSVQRLDGLMEDLQEQAAVQNEWANILSQNVLGGDDDDLLAELDAIQHKQLDEALADAAPVPTGRPNKSVVVPPISDDEQIAKILSSLQQ